MNVLHDLEYYAPARLALCMRAARTWITASATPAAAAITRTWARVTPWLAGLFFVVVYLLVCAWMDRAELRERGAIMAAERHALERHTRALQQEVAELEATRPGELYYLIGGRTPREVRAKLEHVALQLGKAHNELGEVQP